MHFSKLSEVFWEVGKSLYETWSDFVTSFRNVLWYDRTGQYSSCIFNRGGKLDRCVACFDKTKIKIVRPGETNYTRHNVFSGHKCFHFLAYQMLTTPHDLIFHIFGPIEGRLADGYVYSESGMDQSL